MARCDQLMQGRRIRARFELFAQHAVAEQLGNFRQDFEMFLRGGLGHQQEDQ